MRVKTSFYAIRVVAFVLLGTPLVARSAEEQLPVVTRLEGITEYRMENGLSVLMCPDSSVATITVNMVYRVGSRHESMGEAGMTHLLEHMLIHGTENIPSPRDSLNARGADYNGTTWYDRTQFHETLRSSEENLDFALKLEAERMRGALLRDEELATEMKIVENEFQLLENDPETVLSYRMMAVAYAWHGYKRATVGNLSDIRSYSIEKLRKFYREHYRPDNATLVIAGRFDSDRALALTLRYFGPIPCPTAPISQVRTVEPPQEGPRRVILERVASTSRGGLMYHVPAGPHRDASALAVLMEVLTNSTSGLLVTEFTSSGRLVSISGDPTHLQLADPGVFDLRAELSDEEDPLSAVSDLANACETIVGRISERDVECAKARLLKRHRRRFADLNGFAVELSEWIAQGDWRGFFVYRDRVASVTSDEVRGVARHYLRSDNRTLGVLVPMKSPDHVRVPVAETKALMADYQGNEPINKGEDIEISIPALSKRIQKYRIEPGLSVFLLPKRTRGGTAVARLRIRYGTPETLRGRQEAARLLPELLLRGTEARDKLALAEALDLLESEMNFGGHEGVLSIRIESDRGHLAKTIELLGEVLRRPSFKEAEFEEARRERLATLSAQLDDPVERCFNAVRRGLYDFPDDSPFHKATLEERIAELRTLTLREVRSLYKGLVGANHAEAAVVGDFIPGDVLVALGEAIREWNSPDAYSFVDPPCQPVTKSRRRIVILDKPMAIVGYATLFEMQDVDADYPAMLIAQAILGGGPSSRITARLRHREGLSYHAASAMQVEPRIVCANLFGYAFCAPSQADTCLAGLREEVERWIHEGVTADETAAAVAAWKQEFELNLSDDAWLATELLSLAENDRCLAFYSDAMSAMKSISADDVNRVLKERLGKVEFLSVMAGDLLNQHASQN